MLFKNNDMTKLNPYKQNFIWFNLKTTKFSPNKYILGVSTVINIYTVVLKQSSYILQHNMNRCNHTFGQQMTL